MERKYLIYRDVRQCLEQLKRRPIEGMHSCIYMAGEDEAELCFRRTPIRSDYDSTAHKAIYRFYQLMHQTNRCCCNVTSREDVLYRFYSLFRMTLLPRVEAVLGPIERWPRSILNHLFNPPTKKSIRDITAFFYGNGALLHLAYQLFDACNTMIMVSPKREICAWYYTRQASDYTKPPAEYYDVRHRQRMYIGRQYEVADPQPRVQPLLGGHIPPLVCTM